MAANEERCIAIGDGPQDRCLNWPTLERDGRPGNYCAGPHRFAPGVDEVEGWTREIRQHNAMEWATSAFGREQSTNLAQRGTRLLEEAIELYQAAVAATPLRLGDTTAIGLAEAKIRAHKLIDYVFDREIGDLGQEIGGVSVCLLVLAEAANLSADYMEATELDRVLSKPVAEFTKRNAAKNAAGFLATAKSPPQCNYVEGGTARRCTNMRADNLTPGVGGVIGYCDGPVHRFVPLTDSGRAADALDPAWGLIANVSGGDWTKQSPEWQRAAARWRDEHYIGLPAKTSAPVDAEQRNYVGSFKAFPDPPRKEVNRATDEEIALFAAVWTHNLAYNAIAAEPGSATINYQMVIDQLARAARAWCDAHPNDHRTPTEIAQGVTDKNPTRMHTIKPDGSVPTLGLPAKTAPKHTTNPDTHNDKARGLLAYAVCDLIYDELGVRDVNIHGRAEPMDRCDFVNELVPLLMANEWVHIEHPTEPTRQRGLTDHFMKLSGERFNELEAIKRLVGGPHLEYVSSGATALSLVKELVEGHGQAQRVIADLRMLAAQDARAALKPGAAAPVPLIMHCPACHQRHVDVAFADHPHHTHACQHCGFSWRPAVVPTVGVQFLPGFRDE